MGGIVYSRLVNSYVGQMDCSRTVNRSRQGPMHAEAAFRSVLLDEMYLGSMNLGAMYLIVPDLKLMHR